MFLVLHIDDGLITARNQYDIDVILKDLNQEFEKVYSPVGMFLGLHIE